MLKLGTYCTVSVVPKLGFVQDSAATKPLEADAALEQQSVEQV